MNRNIISPDKGTKSLFGIFAAALIVALPLRAYQLIFLIDPETGFYTKTNFTVPLLYVLLILVGIAFIVLSFSLQICLSEVRRKAVRFLPFCRF